jgi:hypothetical protein
LKEPISITDFCKENGLSMMSQQAKEKYGLYLAEFEKENRPHLDEMRNQAQEVLNELSKKK